MLELIHFAADKGGGYCVKLIRFDRSHAKICHELASYVLGLKINCMFYKNVSSVQSKILKVSEEIYTLE